MVTFNCPRCCYNTDIKTHMIRHLHKKKLCELKDLDICPLDYEEDILGKTTPRDIIKMKLENEKLRNQIQILTINGNHNTTTTTSNSHNKTTNIYITLTNYNNPNIDYITELDCKQCLSDNEKSILRMAKKIYFNPKHPENHSIKKTNMKNKLIKIFQDGKWNIGNQDEVIDEIVDKIKDALDKYDEDGKIYEIEHKYENNKKFKTQTSKGIAMEAYNHDPK